MLPRIHCGAYARKSLAFMLGILFCGVIQADNHVDGQDAVNAENSQQVKAKPSQLVDELVTTARRTEENLLEVPIAITAFSREQLEAAGIANISDVAANTPGFSFVDFLGQELSRPVIRGFAPLDIFGESSTAVYVDGIFVSSDVGVNFGYLDVERIEVLKGPQGAHFGNSAFSGAVNFVTAKPTDELKSSFEVQVGDNEKRTLKASVSGPLVSDVLSGRIAALYDDFGGTYNNASGRSQDIGGYKYKVASGSLLFTPTNDLSALWSVYLSDDVIDPAAASTVSANCEPSLSTALPPFGDNSALQNFCGKLPSVGKNDLATIAGERGQFRNVIRTSLKLDWDTNIGTFSSLTGYSKTRDRSLQNGNPGATSTFAQYVTTTTAPSGFQYLGITDLGEMLITNGGSDSNRDYSQEFRFSSPEENRLRFTAGLFAFNQKFNHVNEKLSILASGDVPADLLTFCPACFYLTPTEGVSTIPIGDALYLPWLTADQDEYDGKTMTETKDYAAFGAVEFDISDTLQVYGELRYTDRKQTVTAFDKNGNLTVDDTLNPIPPAAINNEYLTGRASLSWAVTDTGNLYGSIARGQKGGGVDFYEVDGTGVPGLDGRILTSEFKPEKNLVYELGYKAALWDNRMVLDAAIYYTDWEDVVLRALLTELEDGTPIQPVGVNRNVGDAEIKGMELGLNAQLNDAVRLGFGASYSDAEISKGISDRFEDFPTFAPDGDVSGQDLPRQPKLQLNTNLTVRQQLSANWEWYVRGDAFYQSRWYVDLPNQAVIDGRVRANLRLGIESDNYTIELWSTNVFDDDTPDASYRDVYFTNISQDASMTPKFFPWRNTISHPQRRAIGIRILGKFGD